ncbi:MAG: hypothetical protein ACAI25_04115 [Planctomycetota bacterium]
MTWMFVAIVSVLVTLGVWLFVRKELARRAEWFVKARETLGASFGEYSPVPGTDRKASKGVVEGVEAVFSADATTTQARLEVPLAAGVDKGKVYDLIVREEKGGLETSREDVLAGWDDEHARLVFRTRARPDAAATVKTLLEEAKAFQGRLPALLDERAKAKAEKAAKTFGDLTTDGGKHKHLGLKLALSPDEWELVNARNEGVEWERVPPAEGEAPPVELRLYAVPQDDALAAEEPRLRLIERFAGAFVERLPDGSFEDAAPEPKAKSAASVAGAPSATVAVDHLREVVVREEESEPRPYRVLYQGVFSKKAVAVFEVVAPRAEADAILARVLAGATFED